MDATTSAAAPMKGETIRLVGPVQRAFAKRQIDAAPDGHMVTIQEPTRTSVQNNKMQAMLRDLAECEPEGRVWTTEQWKAAVMHACGHQPTYARTLDGEGFICLGYRSRTLRVREMSDLIECMYAFGAEHGVQWSEPVTIDR